MIVVWRCILYRIHFLKEIVQQCDEGFLGFEVDVVEVAVAVWFGEEVLHILLLALQDQPSAHLARNILRLFLVRSHGSWICRYRISLARQLLLDSQGVLEVVRVQSGFHVLVESFLLNLFLFELLVDLQHVLVVVLDLLVGDLDDLALEEDHVRELRPIQVHLWNVHEVPSQLMIVLVVEAVVFEGQVGVDDGD